VMQLFTHLPSTQRPCCVQPTIHLSLPHLHFPPGHM
jgi:hypothetical protein